MQCGGEIHEVREWVPGLRGGRRWEPWRYRWGTPHPTTPSTFVLDRLLNLWREHPDPVVEWAGRRVDFRLTEKRHGVEVGLSSVAREGTGVMMGSGALPAEALMVLRNVTWPKW